MATQINSRVAARLRVKVSQPASNEYFEEVPNPGAKWVLPGVLGATTARNAWSEAARRGLSLKPKGLATVAGGLLGAGIGGLLNKVIMPSNKIYQKRTQEVAPGQELILDNASPSLRGPTEREYNDPSSLGWIGGQNYSPAYIQASRDFHQDLASRAYGAYEVPWDSGSRSTPAEISIQQHDDPSVETPRFGGEGLPPGGLVFPDHPVDVGSEE